MKSMGVEGALERVKGGSYMNVVVVGNAKIKALRGQRDGAHRSEGETCNWCASRCGGATMGDGPCTYAGSRRYRASRVRASQFHHHQKVQDKF